MTARVVITLLDGSREWVDLPEGASRDECVAELEKVRTRDDISDAVLSGAPPVSWDR